MQINTFYISGEIMDFKRIHEKVSKISLRYEVGKKEKTSCVTEFTYFGTSIPTKGMEVTIHGEIRQRIGENKTTGKAFSLTDLIAKTILTSTSESESPVQLKTEDGIPF